jgi:hypothetical protein
VSEGELAPADLRRHRELLEETERILARHPDLSRDTVWHVLLLLDEPPIERLRRALRRGSAGAARSR